MTNPLYIRIPFGTSGDRTTLPVTGSSAGPINYTYGYGTDYSLPRSTDPAALNVERVFMNELFFDITSNIQAYQQLGTPWFISTSDNGGSPFAYAANARVRYNNGSTNDTYVSKIDSNTDLPTVTASWTKVINDPASLSAANMFSAIQTIGVNGTPLIINSLNSTIGKISLKDNGTQRGVIGASSNYAFQIYAANGTTILGGWDTSGLLVPNTDNTYSLGSSSKQWTQLFIATDGVISFDGEDVNLSNNSSNGTLECDSGFAAKYFEVTGTSSPFVGMYQTGGVQLILTSRGTDILSLLHPSSGVNGLTINGATTGFYPSLLASGSDTNIGINIQSKGNASIFLETDSGGSVQFVVDHTASTTNSIHITGSNGGAPKLSTSGGDLAIQPGSGLVQFASAGSFSANGAVATLLGSLGPTGAHTTVQTWLTFKDSSGTTRYVPCF